MYTDLKKKIRDHSAVIGVIGLGYVGIPLAIEFAKKGYTVLGFDVNSDKIRMINKKINPVDGVDPVLFNQLVADKKLQATDDFSQLAAVDCISICVPTPLNKSKDPDVHYILDVTEQISRHRRRGQLIVLESTTYPGTTRELVLPLLQTKTMKAGRDFFLVYSPERVDPGNQSYAIHNTPKIVSGVTTKCMKLAMCLYRQIVDDVVSVSSTEAAEMTKLLENTFRSVNIGLVNELAIMCHKLGVDVWEVIDAAATKPFGYIKFYPGPGLGGHCIPIDPHYLSWKLKKLNYRARFIELAGEINSEMPEYVVARLMDGLNKRKKTVNGSKVMVLGVAYKKDVADTRESPALDILHILENKGARVYYHDPHIPEVILNSITLQSSTLSPAFIRKMDCVIIATDHSAIDYRLIEQHAHFVLDTRNVFKESTSNRVVRL